MHKIIFMEIRWWLVITGIIFLALRIWLVEIQLKEPLAKENRYFSRIICYYLAINMIFNLKIIAINSILVSSVASFSIITILCDFTFFSRMKSQYPNQTRKTYFYLVLERLTLHFPILIAGFAMIGDNYLNYVNLSNGWFPIIMGALLFFMPFIILDPRIRKKEVWPLGPIIFSFGVAQTVGMVVNFLFFV
jgi:hypothetical protein